MFALTFLTREYIVSSRDGEDYEDGINELILSFVENSNHKMILFLFNVKGHCLRGVAEICKACDIELITDWNTLITKLGGSNNETMQ